MDEMGSLEESGFKDQLQALLEDAESFVPGSHERNNSLEQIRSLLVDRSSQIRKSGLSGTGDGMALGTPGQSLPRSNNSRSNAFLHGVSSPEERQSVLELYDPSDSAMTTIHEPTSVWGGAGHGYDGEDYDMAFQMEDLHEQPSVAATTGQTFPAAGGSSALASA